jgi:predicted Zn-dependent protease
LFAFLLAFLLLADTEGARVLLQRGLQALQQGDLTSARTDLEQASQADPQNAYVWVSLAQVYLRSKNSGNAAVAAAKAEKAAGANAAIWRALSMYYSETGDAARAAKLDAKYRELRWESAKADSQLAFEYSQVLLSAREFTRAAEVLAPALAAHPNDPQLVLALGVARYGERSFEDAAAQFLKVIQLDPSIEQPYAFLGRLLDQSGTHLGEITKQYEARAAREPNNAEAQFLLAKALLVANSRDPKAEPLLRRAVALDPKSWEAHYELGVVLLNRRAYQDAEKELSTAAGLNPEESAIHYHLARVYDRLGQPERAQEERDIHRQLAAKAPPRGMASDR